MFKQNAVFEKNVAAHHLRYARKYFDQRNRLVASPPIQFRRGAWVRGRDEDLPEPCNRQDMLAAVFGRPRDKTWRCVNKLSPSEGGGGW